MTEAVCWECGRSTKREDGLCKRCAKELEAASRSRAPADVCTNCGYHGPGTRARRGGWRAEAALYLLLVVPGIAYSVWRRTHLPVVCRRCGSPHIVPDDTPEGQRILARVAREDAELGVDDPEE